MIQNIIFDVGKVLVSYEPDEMMRNIGLSEEQIAIVNKALFENPLWDDCDRSLESDEVLLERAFANVNNDADAKEAIMKAWNHIGDAIALLPYVEEWLENLKSRGYQLYVLSNYGAHTYQLTEHKMKFLPYMEGALFSCACKYMKPEKAIYQKLLTDYQLNPQECVFIDDRQVNIDGAVSCGIQGLLFTDYKTTAQALDELLK